MEDGTCYVIEGNKHIQTRTTNGGKVGVVFDEAVNDLERVTVALKGDSENPSAQWNLRTIFDLLFEPEKAPKSAPMKKASKVLI